MKLDETKWLVEVYRDVSYGADTVHLHSHVFYEIIYCCSCSGMQYLIGSERYSLQSGDVLIITPGVPHRPIWSGETTALYHREVMWLSVKFVEGIKSQISSVKYKEEKEHFILHTAGTKWEAIAEYFHAGVKEAEGREFAWQAAVCANAKQALTMLARAMKEGAGGKVRAERPELLEQVMNYIEANLGEKITLEGTAKRFLVSTSTISQIFHKKMGDSFYRIVTQRRLIAAKNKILEGMGLEEVSTQVGFRDYSTFYRAFKQEYGISPRQYRQLDGRQGEAE